MRCLRKRQTIYAYSSSLTVLYLTQGKDWYCNCGSSTFKYSTFRPLHVQYGISKSMLTNLSRGVTWEVCWSCTCLYSSSSLGPVRKGGGFIEVFISSCRRSYSSWLRGGTLPPWMHTYLDHLRRCCTVSSCLCYVLGVPSWFVSPRGENRHSS